MEEKKFFSKENIFSPCTGRVCINNIILKYAL